jgi:hypothetical protein
MTLIGILKKKLMGVEAIFRDYEIPQKSYINPQIDSKSIIKNKIYKNVKGLVLSYKIILIYKF